MNNSRLFAFVVAPALFAAAGCDKGTDPMPAARDTPTKNQPTTTKPEPAPDNTAKNKVDRGGETKTPMDQSQSSADIKTTADIRRAIMNDKAMSTNAQNCKIITDKSGMVTLRGVVDSQAEKDSIGTMANTVAGAAKVDNQLEVKVD